jgi:CelD/BcsL family acetyltransferase involved in cellulose biosynthesis
VTPDLAVRWITDEAEFLTLREPWNRLVPAARGRDLFLRHEWFDAAWQWRKNERCTLRIALVSRGAQLIGICPLVLQATQHGGLPARRLEFLSVPDTQFCDLVCDRAEAAAVGAAMLSALRDRAREWDVLDLRYLTEDAAAAVLAQHGAGRAGVECERTPWDVNSYIDLTESWEAFYGRRSRSLKKANNLAANRLRKAGNLELQWMRGECARPERSDSLLEELVAVSAKSWKVGTGLTLDNPRPSAFIRHLTRHAMEQGWLSMWCLRLDGKAAAMEYQLISSGEVFALRADFDQTLEAISPGSYLSVQLLQQLFASGLRRYWLGPGPNPYKARWTEQSETLYRVSAFSRTARGRLYRLNEQIVRPAARKVRAALRRARRGQSDLAGADK